ASVTAILVRVFFTTVNVALSPSDRRSSASWATVSPRYSVSTAPDESLNRSVSSATAATFSALAMCLLSITYKHVLRCVIARLHESAPARGARGGTASLAWSAAGDTAQFTCAGCPAPGPRDPGRSLRPSRATASSGLRRLQGTCQSSRAQIVSPEPHPGWP